jgi:hypothetical protein
MPATRAYYCRRLRNESRHQRGSESVERLGAIGGTLEPEHLGSIYPN